jgi:hypothetical protein
MIVAKNGLCDFFQALLQVLDMLVVLAPLVDNDILDTLLTPYLLPRQSTPV